MACVRDIGYERLFERAAATRTFGVTPSLPRVVSRESIVALLRPDLSRPRKGWTREEGRKPEECIGIG